MGRGGSKSQEGLGVMAGSRKVERPAKAPVDHELQNNSHSPQPTAHRM